MKNLKINALLTISIFLVLILSSYVLAASKVEFSICDEKGQTTGKTFTKATITVDGIDQSGNYLYRGIDIGVFNKKTQDSVYQKRVQTDTLNIQISDFGSIDKYKYDEIYVFGYRVLYSLIDNEEGSIIETDWKMISKNMFKLKGINNNVQESLFSDVKDDHWAYEALKYCLEKSILSGYDNGTFGPNDKITREQYAKILATSFELKNSASVKSTFADVFPEDWSYNYIQAAKDYIEGFKVKDAIYFKGKSEVTREVAVSAIIKVKGLSNSDVDTSILKTFKDYNEISPKYLKDMAVAYNTKMAVGDNNTLNPKGTLTRAEAVMLLYRALK